MAFYSKIRIAIWAVILFFVITMTIKSKIGKKKKIFLGETLVCIILCSISMLVPIEDLFLNFKSAEDVFSYVNSGKIERVIEGNDSCLILYRNEKKEETYMAFYPKTSNGYRIGIEFLDRENIPVFDQETHNMFNIVHMLGTEDYYIYMGGFVPQADVDISDSENSEFIKCFEEAFEINRIQYYNYIAIAFVNHLEDGYYITIDGQKTFIDI